jgi:hypothetical protein
MASNKARVSETRFNPNGGIDLDAIAERFDERNSGIEAAELDFDNPPQSRKETRMPKRVAQFS